MKRTVILMTCLAVFPGALGAPALAGPRGDVMDGSARCASVADDRQWLDCYYGAAQPMLERLGLSPAPSSQLALVPPPGKSQLPAKSPPHLQAAQPPAKPGFFERLVARDELSREPQMVSYRFDKQHRFTVTLSDGTTWRQSPDDTHRAAWSKPPSSYHVLVNKGHGGTGILDANDGFYYEVQQVN